MRRNIISIILIVCIALIFSACSNYNKEESGLVYGQEDAPIEIVNYTSFQCPDCVTLHEKLHDSLKKYIDNGDVKFIEKPIDIKRFEFDDVIYKHMNEEQAYDFEYLSKIYETQVQWREFKSESEVLELLELGADENSDNIKDLKEITKEKDNLEIKEVPTMLINGEIISNSISVDEFENKINLLLNK